MSIILKHPAGEFTQAELAAFNGLDKAAVYLPLRAAVADGTLELAGTRNTGGKRPSNLYRLASSKGQTVSTKIIAPVPITAPLTPSPIVETPPTASSSPGVPFSQLSTRFDGVLLSQDNTPSAPIIQPVVTVTSPAVPVRNLAPNPAYPCPLCKGPMTELPDATGVMVKCFNEPCDAQCHENPFGHGKNAKDAYDTAKDKFHG